MYETIKDFFEKPLRYVYFSIPDYYRYGKHFRRYYDFLQQSQWWNKKQHEEYQIRKLSNLLHHSYETVPYYKRVFDERGLKPKDIQNFNDLKQLPYLTKDLIKENSDHLISAKYEKEKLTLKTTGGSTGVPMGFYVDETQDKIQEWVHVANIWSRAGYDVKDRNRRVILMGNKPKNGLFEYRNKDLILSSFSLSDDNVQRYINLIEKFDPDFVHAYPSSIMNIANYLLLNKIKIKANNLKAILCVSENLYELQRNTIEAAFNKRVFSFYGHSEHACIAGECEHSNHYHISSEYGITEIINENNKEAAKEDEIGEIIATGFHNYAMPLIRYKTQDLAVNTNKRCICGRDYKIIKGIEGREQEVVYTKEGVGIMLTGSYKILHKISDKIKNGQFYQDRAGVLELKLVPNSNYVDLDTSYLYHEIKRKFGNDIEFKISLVTEIGKTKNGKHKFLDQRIQK